MSRVSRFPCLLAAFAVALSLHAEAARKTQTTVPVVMLSDLHFDPYQDPEKFEELRAASIEAWPAILDAPPSGKQVADFAALQTACKARGVDSSWSLLSDSLKAAHTQVRKPLFVTVSGDLLAHGFDCRLRTLRPKATAEEMTQFAEKTINFLAFALRKSFPGVPVYIALGNNDSGCTDYQESPSSEFLRDAAQNFATDVLDKNSQTEIRGESSALGDYDVALPAPLAHTRLLVLQNMFQSRYYEACGGKKDPQAAKDQIEWLHSRLLQARERHEHVWVMAHIPPGIDVYSSFHKYVLNPGAMCSVKQPVEFLGSDAFVNTLTDFADVVRLAIFAHTHMDEMKLLHNAAGATIPAKQVPSISPVNGNTPAFTVAQVDPSSATMTDYSVYARGTASGAWALEYTYSKVYGMPDYSAASVKNLTEALAADKNGDTDLSRKYQKWFYPGDLGLYGLGLHQIWPAYACSTVENGGDAFHSCMCPAKEPAAE